MSDLEIAIEASKATLEQSIASSGSILRTGVCMGVDLDAQTATIRLDVDIAQGNSDALVVGLMSIIPALGSRCAVLLTPPSGAYLFDAQPLQTSWTPAIYQGSALATTIRRAKYSVIGNRAFVDCDIVASGSSGVTGAIIVTGFPFGELGTQNIQGVMRYHRTGTDWFTGGVEVVSSGASNSLYLLNGGQETDYLGADPSFQVFSGHTLQLSVSLPVRAT